MLFIDHFVAFFEADVSVVDPAFGCENPSNSKSEPRGADVSSGIAMTEDLQDTIRPYRKIKFPPKL